MNSSKEASPADEVISAFAGVAVPPITVSGEENRRTLAVPATFTVQVWVRVTVSVSSNPA